jgi:hypothetical protein
MAKDQMKAGDYTEEKVSLIIYEFYPQGILENLEKAQLTRQAHHQRACAGSAITPSLPPKPGSGWRFAFPSRL